jgi:hypothetical protein
MKNKGRHYEVVYTSPDGTESVHYRRPVTDCQLAWQVKNWRRRWKGTAEEKVYSIRRIA